MSLGWYLGKAKIWALALMLSMIVFKDHHLSDLPGLMCDRGDLFLCTAKGRLLLTSDDGEASHT